MALEDRILTTGGDNGDKEGAKCSNGGDTAAAEPRVDGAVA